MKPHARADSESVGSLMSRRVLTCESHETLGAISAKLHSASWDDLGAAYVVDAEGKLLGWINLGACLSGDPSQTASQLMKPPPATLSPGDDQEKAVFLAIKHDLGVVPVVELHGRFAGVMTAKTILAVMREEHLEDALITAGMRGKGSHIVKLATGRLGHVISSRAPWLMAGLLVGLGLGLISSWFEGALHKHIAIAYFIPVVAYIADSVGTQSEAITVRALTVLKLSSWRYLLKEFLVGTIMGTMIGLAGGLGAALISQSSQIGVAVGLALFVASALAATIASGVPMAFNALKLDPAMGSGPLATALQDVISVVVYFGFAMALVR